MIGDQKNKLLDGMDMIHDNANALVRLRVNDRFAKVKV